MAIRNIRILIKDKNKKQFIHSLVKTKQHLKNIILLIYNKLEKEDKKLILNFAIVRQLLANDVKYKPETKRLIEILNSNNELRQLYKQLLEFKIYSNKIIVDIVKELNSNIQVAHKNYNNGNINYFNFKPKKLKNIYKGSIDINSNLVKYKNGLIYANIFSKLSDKGKMFFSYYVNPDLLKNKNIKNITLGFIHDEYYMIITYEKEIKLNNNINNKYASIDLGFNTLITLFVQDVNSLLIDFSSIKRINRKLMNLIPKLDKKKNKHLKNYLYNQRNRIHKNEIHKIVNYIIKYLKKNNVGTLVIGRNKEMKSNINIGKNNNKIAYLLPYELIYHILEYRLNEEGITYIEQEESYTSKLSCINDEVWKFDIKHKPNQPSGVRGLMQNGKLNVSLFKDKKENLIFHADINGAINILQKYLKQKISIQTYQLCNPKKIKNEFDFLKVAS
jgi:IS605 OrfB family transposase